jgi:hypothetical protein
MSILRVHLLSSNLSVDVDDYIVTAQNSQYGAADSRHHGCWWERHPERSYLIHTDPEQGSSGLSMLKTLRDDGFKVICYERRSQVGGLWAYTDDKSMTTALRSTKANISKYTVRFLSWYTGFPHWKSHANSYLPPSAECRISRCPIVCTRNQNFGSYIRYYTT